MIIHILIQTHFMARHAGEKKLRSYNTMIGATWGSGGGGCDQGFGGLMVIRLILESNFEIPFFVQFFLSFFFSTLYVLFVNSPSPLPTKENKRKKAEKKKPLVNTHKIFIDSFTHIYLH